MLGVLKRPAKTPDGKTSEGKQGQDEQMQWTRGPDLAATLMTIGFWVLLVLGGIGGLGTLTSTSGAGQSASDDGSGDGGQERQLAQGHALQVARAWASASQEDPGQVTELLPQLSVSDLPAAVDPVVGVVVQDAEPVDEVTWAVTVAVTSRTTASEDEPAAPSTTQYLRVAVAVDGHSARVLTLPAIVAGPAPMTMPELAYPRDLPSRSEVAGSIGGFMSALLAGEGDVARYTTPGAEMRPVTPAPYAEVQVTEVRTTQTESDPIASPTGGQVLEVLVSVTASTEDRTDRLQYPLQLTARDGRWEVTRVRPGPLVTDDVQDEDHN